MVYTSRLSQKADNIFLYKDVKAVSEGKLLVQ